MVKAIGHGHVPPPELSMREEIYDSTLSHADIDLADLLARLTREGGPCAVSLLLSGPSGTGKSAFARCLAAKMGLKVLHKRGSDIFGMFVGQTEQNIAAAFAEAHEGKEVPDFRRSGFPAWRA
jgi:transitional endoplasmic reticulum ATPase